ncbi:carbon monoxide dehydrogenase [Streptomyces sp. NPDC005494]|uniref:carbon monoxide dehydrogenase n=1 Tax=Streptomyces sp. NPDC005494 TaxID=3364715 RepID=UPI0036866816
MEHEVFVPVPVTSLRRTLGDPARVARCVPGLQRDADASAGPLAGRLKFRADGHTITYRGALTLRPSDEGEPGAFSVTGEGVEARGTGSAKLALTIGLAETDGGTTIRFTGTASGDGRVVDLDEATALASAQRLLDRFTQQLVTETLATREDSSTGEDTSAREAEEATEPSAPAAPAGETPDVPTAKTPDAPTGKTPDVPAGKTPDVPPGQAPGTPAGKTPDAPTGKTPDAPAGKTPDVAPGQAPGTPAGKTPSDRDSVFDTPVPDSSLDPSAELEFTVPDEPPAEAAHARRTMIGRSTEEVDHAPPRGRYAPVPSPEAGAAGITLRWAAPAAALAIASAVVVGRALRRRRP